MRKSAMVVLGILWAVVLGGGPVLAFQLPDTGQTTCYDGAGNVITCPSAG